MKKNYKIVIGILIGLLCSGICAYAANQILASEVIYKNDKTVQSAIEELYNKTQKCPEGKTCISKSEAKGKFPICKRATELHTEICNQNNPTYYCSGEGYNIGDTITYGNETVTSGELNSGDAFDCDVNLDGTYDKNTERFYYVSEYYNTSTKAFENDTAVLIYYNNTNKGIADSTDKGRIVYYADAEENWHGPVTAKENLPTNEQWINITLKNEERAILNQSGGNITIGGTLPSNFSYEGYAARLLTTQEIEKACNITVGNLNAGELDTCKYLMENTQYSDKLKGTRGYWIETPFISNKSNARVIHVVTKVVNSTTVNVLEVHGTRPAIEVPMSRIEY